MHILKAHKASHKTYGTRPRRHADRRDIHRGNSRVRQAGKRFIRESI